MNLRGRQHNLYGEVKLGTNINLVSVGYPDFWWGKNHSPPTTPPKVDRIILPLTPRVGGPPTPTPPFYAHCARGECIPGDH